MSTEIYAPHVHPGPLCQVLGPHDAVSGLVRGRRAHGEGPRAAAAAGEAGRHGGGGRAEAAAHGAVVATAVVVVVEAVRAAVVVDPVAIAVAVPIEIGTVASVTSKGTL